MFVFFFVFSWQVLHDRIPTKDNLLSRCVISLHDASCCVWCPDVRESSSHLFLHCKVAHVIWCEIFRWLGVVIVMPQNLFTLFDCLCGVALNKIVRKGFLLVWHVHNSLGDLAV
jgi:hypothetical protein